MIKFFGGQTVGGFQICYCFFHVGPVCVLGQYRTGDYLELVLAGPPVLGAKAVEKKTVNFGQPFACHCLNFCCKKTVVFGYCNFDLFEVNSLKFKQLSQLIF